jgi:hypothetical protein
MTEKEMLNDGWVVGPSENRISEEYHLEITNVSNWTKEQIENYCNQFEMKTKINNESI